MIALTFITAAISALVLASGPPNRTPDPGEGRSPEWSLRVYAGAVPFVGGCTPMLQKFEDGDLAWKGCPTWTCPSHDECQAEFSSEDTLGRCKCLTGGMQGVLCEGIVVFDPSSGLPVDWGCFKHDCPDACVAQHAPAGPGIFAVCDC